jgi:hypothetical protein
MDSVAFRAGFAVRNPRSMMTVSGITDAPWAGERVPNSAPMRFLTRSYVEWLRLRECVVHSLSSCVYFVPENARKPETPVVFQRGVRCWGRLYLRTPDGLAWELAPWEAL